MRNPSDSLQVDPTAKTGNKKNRLRNSTALAMVAALSLAACSDKPDTVKTTFPSYQAAKTGLDNLVKSYGDDENTSNSAEAKINGAFEAAIPIFRDHVSSTVANLTSFHSGSYQIDTWKGPMKFDIKKTVSDDGKSIDSINFDYFHNEGNLLVTHNTHNGPVSIDYVNHASNVAGDPLGKSGLSINNDNFGTFLFIDTDGDPDTIDDQSLARLRFKEDFGDGSNAGPDLTFAFGMMRQVDSLLNMAISETVDGQRINQSALIFG